MKIVQLTAENVKRLQAVQIKPDGSIVQITGRNGQGKSSVLDAIAYALGGKSVQPAKPIREGTDHASIVVDLGDIIVKRSWTANDKTYLSVESKEGAKYPSPQAILDKLVGQLTFDPLDFIHLNPREQVDTLKRVAGLNFDELERRREEMFTERTIANRDVKAIEAQLAGLPDVDAPDAEVSISELAKERAAAKDVSVRKQDLLRQSQANVAVAQGEEAAATRCLDEVKLLRSRIESLLKQAEGHTATAQKDMAEARALKGKAEAIVEPDLEAIDRRILDADSINQNVRAKKRRAEKVSALGLAKKRADELSTGLELIEAEKSELLSKAPMPVPGLSFTPDGVTFNGVPFEQASSAEQLRVSVAMGFSLNPKLRVMLVRDGSLLDANGLAMLGELAAEKEGQVWIERVTDGQNVGIVIEDGMVAGVEAKEAAAV